MWCIDIARLTSLESLFGATLDDGERERASRFVIPADALRYRVAHGALRAILGDKLRIAPSRVCFTSGPRGKLRLRDGDLHFSLSHSGALALVAVSPDREVGVDVEEVRAVPAAAALARRFFSPREAQAIACQAPPDRDLRFMRRWTVMEAVLKAEGTGLAGAEEGFSTPNAWTVRALAPAPTYVGAVAGGGGDFALRMRRFPVSAPDALGSAGAAGLAQAGRGAAVH